MNLLEGPYLSAALLCEKVLVEQDGVKSAIRIIDRVTHTVAGPSPPAQMEPFEHEMSLLIKLKSGSARGVYPLRVVFVKPSGESPVPMEQPVNFEGEEDRGVDVIASLKIAFDLTGIYWFEIYLAGNIVTRVPFRVIYLPQVMQMHAAGGGPPQGGRPPRDS